MEKLYTLFLKWKKARLERAMDGPFDPEVSAQLECLQCLLEQKGR